MKSPLFFAGEGKFSLKQISVIMSFWLQYASQKEGRKDEMKEGRKRFSLYDHSAVNTELLTIHKYQLSRSPYLNFETTGKTEEYFLNGGTFFSFTTSEQTEL